MKWTLLVPVVLILPVQVGAFKVQVAMQALQYIFLVLMMWVCTGIIGIPLF